MKSALALSLITFAIVGVPTTLASPTTKYSANLSRGRIDDLIDAFKKVVANNVQILNIVRSDLKNLEEDLLLSRRIASKSNSKTALQVKQLTLSDDLKKSEIAREVMTGKQCKGTELCVNLWEVECKFAKESLETGINETHEQGEGQLKEAQESIAKLGKSLVDTDAKNNVLIGQCVKQFLLSYDELEDCFDNKMNEFQTDVQNFYLSHKTIRNQIETINTAVDQLYDQAIQSGMDAYDQVSNNFQLCLKKDCKLT